MKLVSSLPSSQARGESGGNLMRTKLDPNKSVFCILSLKKKERIKPLKLMRDAGKGNLIPAVDLELGYVAFSPPLT